MQQIQNCIYREQTLSEPLYSLVPKLTVLEEKELISTQPLLLSTHSPLWSAQARNSSKIKLHSGPEAPISPKSEQNRKYLLNMLNNDNDKYMIDAGNISGQ